jgi:malate dehydrogenase
VSVVGVDDVEASDGRLCLRPGDVLTPLARDRAADLGVVIEERPSAPGAAGTARSPARPESAPSGSPPSGALYRRGAPVVTERVRVEHVLGPDAARPRRESRTGRATVVGAGHVGATTALRLAEADVFDEVVLVDVVPGLAAGLALDLWHSSGLRRFATRLWGTTDLAEAADSDFVVVTAGRPRQPGMSRTDLTAVNAAIVGDVSENIRRHSPDAIVIVVTNPLDEMTHLAWQTTGFPAPRVMGMAGVLDAARFCALAALAAGERPDAVRAVALGSHGDEMVVPLSQARIGAEAITRRLDAPTLAALVDRTRQSGAEVVKLLGKGSAYFAPAAAVAAMVLAMANDTGEVLPACVRADGAYGLDGVYVGLPARLGAAGVIEVVELPLVPAELEELRLAARRIGERVGELTSA